MPLDCSDEDWRAANLDKVNSPQRNKNRNLVKKVVPGSIVMVPRPSDGKIYCGRITSRFRVKHDDHIWAKAEPEFTEKKVGKADRHQLKGEIAQGWDVEEFVPLPFPLVPAHIRRHLFSQTTFGIIPTGDFGDPVDIIGSLMDTWMAGERVAHSAWTTDEAEVRKRLYSVVTPTLLEHLAVSLLQLERPDESWIMVGGSGDGGVDGMGYDSDGKVVGLLQCKWFYNGGPVFEKNIEPDYREGAIKYLAFMAGKDVGTSGADDVKSDDWLVKSIIKHADRLPFALTIRVGPPR